MEKRRTNFELRELVFNELVREPCKSYWRRGVRRYAIGLLSELDFLTVEKSTLHSALLSGASDWCEYSYGGCALISDRDIAARLCTPSEWRKKKCGERRPNRDETWLDVQVRALYQAEIMLVRACRAAGVI